MDDITVQIVARDETAPGITSAKAQLAGFAATASASAGQVRTASAEFDGFFSQTQSGSGKIIGLTRALSDMTPQVERAGTATLGMGRAFTVGTREARAMFDEISSGRIRYLPGTLAIFLQQALGLSPAMLGATAAVAIFAGGLGYLAYRSAEAADAVAKMKIAADTAGDIGLTTRNIHTLIGEMDQLPSVTQKDARAVISAFEMMGNQSAASVDGLSLAATRYSETYGVKLPNVTKEFVSVLENENVSIQKLRQTFPGLTHEQEENYLAVSRSGTENQRAAAIMEIMLERTRDQKAATDDYNAGMLRSASNFVIYLGTLAGGDTAEQAHTVLLQKAVAAWDQQTAAIQRSINALRNAKPTNEQLKLTADEAAAAEDHFSTRLAETTKHLADLKAGQAAVKATESGAELAADMDRYSKAIKAANDNLTELKHSQQQKDTLGERTGAAALAKEGQDEIATVRATIAQINANENLGANERLALIQEHYNALIASTRINSQQRLAIERDYYVALAAAHKANAAEQAKIDNDDTRTALELARMAYEQKRNELDAEVKDHRITEDQKIEILRAALQQMETLELQAENQEEIINGKSVAAFQHAENQKLLIKARYAQEMAKLDSDAANQSAQAWRTGDNAIIDAEHSLVQGIFSGRESIKQIIFRSIDQWLQKSAEAYLDELIKTRSFAAAKTALDAAMGFKDVAITTGTEAAKTSATIAGETARLVAKRTAKAIGSAEDLASGSASIMNDAYQSAAGAYKAVVGIPIVGPILAPIAAGVAFAAVMAFDSLTSLDVGTTRVPHDMPAMLHEGEMVAPKPFAAGLRDLMSGTNTVGQGNPSVHTYQGGDIHLHYNPQIVNGERQPLHRILSRDSADLRGWLQEEMRNGWLRNMLMTEGSPAWR